MPFFAFLHVALLLLEGCLELKPEFGDTRCWIFVLHIGSPVDFGQYMSHTQLKPFYRSFFRNSVFLLIIDLIHVDSTRTKFGIIWSTETPANRSI